MKSTTNDTSNHANRDVDRARALEAATGAEERRNLEMQFAKEDSEAERARLEAIRDQARSKQVVAVKETAGKVFWRSLGKLNHSGVIYENGDEITHIGEGAISALPADQIERC